MEPDDNVFSDEDWREDAAAECEVSEDEAGAQLALTRLIRHHALAQRYFLMAAQAVSNLEKQYRREVSIAKRIAFVNGPAIEQYVGPHALGMIGQLADQEMEGLSKPTTVEAAEQNLCIVAATKRGLDAAIATADTWWQTITAAPRQESAQLGDIYDRLEIAVTPMLQADTKARITEKSKTITTQWTKRSIRAGRPSRNVINEEAAILKAKKLCPEAIKSSLLKSAIPDACMPKFKGLVEDVVGPDSFKIDCIGQPAKPWISPTKFSALPLQLTPLSSVYRIEGETK